VTARRGRRRKQILDDIKERREYCKLKEEALDRTVRRTGFGRGYGPVVRQTA
jgi:transcription elongation GreA/GreB family factor